MKLYVAKNKRGVVRLYNVLPKRIDECGRTELHGKPRPIKMCRDWQTYGMLCCVDEENLNFPISWKDEPKEITISLK